MAAEILNGGGNELIEVIYHLLHNIWVTKTKSDYNLSSLNRRSK